MILESIFLVRLKGKLREFKIVEHEDQLQWTRPMIEAILSKLSRQKKNWLKQLRKVSNSAALPFTLNNAAD